MHTIRMSAFGGPDVLERHDAPVPVPGPGEVLVRVGSAAVNYSDVVRRSGRTYPFPTPLPFTPGSEVAGTVAALGEGVDGLAVGTAVFGLAGADGSGGYAQYVLARAAQVAAVPPGVDLDAASGIVVAGSTAVLALTEVARVRSGETVLVEGAGGGVGSIAVQVATLLGARVIASASTPERRAAATAAGAVAAVDPALPEWPDRVREASGGAGADVVLHVGGARTFDGCLRALAPFGRLVVLGTAGGDPLVLGADAVRTAFYDPAPGWSLHAFNLGLFFGLRPEAAGAALGTLVEHVSSGRVAVPVGATLPLSRAADAHRLLESRASVGKVVLKPWEDDG